MPPGRQAQLSALTASYPVAVRATPDCGDGLFATAACEADTVLISDVPLAWLPSSKQRLPTCAGCGACLGSAGALLARLTGDSVALALPHFQDAAAEARTSYFSSLYLGAGPVSETSPSLCE